VETLETVVWISPPTEVQMLILYFGLEMVPNREPISVITTFEVGTYVKAVCLQFFHENKFSHNYHFIVTFLSWY
jgi:hypothetical protein